MQRLRWLIVGGALCLIPPLIRADAPGSSLLTEEDRGIEWTSREEGPALSSSLNAKEKWESYNEWRCFPIRAIELTCNEIDAGDGDWRKSPMIIATIEHRHFEYDLDPTTPWDCEFTLNEWREVIGDSAEICLFAARLQPLDDGGSLWVLDRIKSERSSWAEYESASYAHALHEDDENRNEEEASVE
jgi:hypothetical protein